MATSSTLPTAMNCSGPNKEDGGASPPTFMASSGELIALVPISRFSQPTRVEEPGFASSSSSIAAKCDRVGEGNPVACTAASLPAFHSGSSGFRLGCSPKKPSVASRALRGIAILGRAA